MFLPHFKQEKMEAWGREKISPKSHSLTLNFNPAVWAQWHGLNRAPGVSLFTIKTSAPKTGPGTLTFVGWINVGKDQQWGPVMSKGQWIFIPKKTWNEVELRLYRTLNVSVRNENSFLYTKESHCTFLINEPSFQQLCHESVTKSLFLKKKD